MPAKKCDKNGGCNEDFYHCVDGFCLPRRRCKLKADCEDNE